MSSSNVVEYLTATSPLTVPSCWIDIVTLVKLLRYPLMNANVIVRNKRRSWRPRAFPWTAEVFGRKSMINMIPIFCCRCDVYSQCSISRNVKIDRRHRRNDALPKTRESAAVSLCPVPCIRPTTSRVAARKINCLWSSQRPCIRDVSTSRSGPNSNSRSSVHHVDVKWFKLNCWSLVVILNLSPSLASSLSGFPSKGVARDALCPRLTSANKRTIAWRKCIIIIISDHNNPPKRSDFSECAPRRKREDETHRLICGIIGCRCIIQYYFNPPNIIIAKSATVPIRCE